MERLIELCDLKYLFKYLYHRKYVNLAEIGPESAKFS